MRTLDAVPGGELILKDQPIENWLDAKQLDPLLRANGFPVVTKCPLMFGEGRRGLNRFTNRKFAVLARKPLSGLADDK